MKKCVVTGAAGFTGYSLVENLIAHGYFVYAVVRPQSEHNGRLAGMSNVQIVYADMSEYVKRMLEVMEYDVSLYFECDYGAAWS